MESKAYTIGEPYHSYVDGCARRELVFSRCQACGGAQLCGYRACRACGSQALQDEASRGHGRIASFTTIHKAAAPRFKAIVPFTLALIELDEGFRAMMRIADRREFAIGDPIEVRFAVNGENGELLPIAERAP